MLPLFDGDLPRRRFPIITICLIAISALVFLYALKLGSADRTIFYFKYGLIPSELTGGGNLSGLRPGGVGTTVYDIDTPFSNWTTIFTAMFIHGDWLHFVGNMLFLWVFGRNIEDRFGPALFLLFYLVTGLAATWMQIAIDTQSDVPLIGASGAIAGVLGAYLLLYPYNRITTVVIFFLITVVRVPVVYLLGFWLFLQFVGSVGTLAPSAQIGGIAYWAHIGGFAAGALMVALYRLASHEPLWPRRRGF
jgi:membrane associated rhomboid family serine protease